MASLQSRKANTANKVVWVILTERHNEREKIYTF